MNDTKRESGKVISLVLIAILIAALYVSTRNNPVHGQSQTITGPMPSIAFNFDSTGAPLQPVYCTILKGNVSTGGTFSFTGTGPLVNGSSAWTNPSGAWLENGGMMSSGTAVATSYTAYPSTFTIVSNAITVSGTAKSPTTLIVLGATAVASTVAEPLTLKVCAN